MKRSLLFVLLLVACETVDPRPAPYECAVENASQQEQAIAVLLSELSFTLPEELGGLTCTPDGSEACAQRLDEECLARLDAVVGEPVTTSIGLTNRSGIPVNIQRIAIEGDCAAAWQLTSAPDFVEPGTTAPVALTFVGVSVGTCTARFVVTADASNFDDQYSASIALSVAVTEPPEEN